MRTRICKYLNIKYNYVERGFFFFQHLLQRRHRCSAHVNFFYCCWLAVVAALLLALQNEIYFNAFALLLLFIHLPWVLIAAVVQQQQQQQKQRQRQLSLLGKFNEIHFAEFIVSPWIDRFMMLTLDHFATLTTTSWHFRRPCRSAALVPFFRLISISLTINKILF